MGTVNEYTEREYVRVSDRANPRVALTVNLEKAAWISLLVLAVLTRFYSLGERVISHDESLHTYYSWELSEGRGFQHSPLMHGPFQFHALALSFFLLDDSDFTARVPSALFGVSAVGLLWCLRGWIGRRGAFVCAVLMTISPVLLYYSRYVRNEALVIVWVLVMVISMVRYCGDRKAQWLYLFAAAMAFNHATKETAFIYDAIFMLYFGLVFVRENLQQPWASPMLKRVFGLLLFGAGVAAGSAIVLSAYGVGADVMADDITVGGSDSGYPAFMMAAIAGVLFALAAAVVILWSRWHVVRRYVSFDILVVMGTLVLPQLVALPVRLILNADPLDYSAAGMWRTGPVLAILLLISVAGGLIWDWKRWLLCAGIFYAIYVFFFTTMFSNGHGLVTGLVGSLGYWVEQQGVERGGQPWYYY
ncbi:MAG: TIGR03663 family protein, partial [Anaerolineales bacterium]|nr:TIGR03663 family protein [Anaerolineales bacterium]